MMLQFFFLIFSLFFSLINASHFLGGSFTFRHIQQEFIDYQTHKSILVEIRFHITNHYFICTPEQINDHLKVYLIGEFIPYDNIRKQYLWFNADVLKENSKFYNIKCSNVENEFPCKNFTEEIWAYCESANNKSGYSILRRQFLLTFEKFEKIEIYYSACCWAESIDKPFHFSLVIEKESRYNNSSPYPHIPASYYVDIKQPRDTLCLNYN